jgi:hypothetical protein
MIQSTDPLNELLPDKSPNRIKAPVETLVAIPEAAAREEPSIYTFICKPVATVS